MSKCSNAKLSFATVVLTQFERTSITYQSGRLSSADLRLSQIGLALEFCMLYDAILTTSQTASSRDTVMRIIHDCVKSGVDVFNFIETLSSYDSDLLRYGVIKLHPHRDDDPIARRVVGGLVAHEVPLWPTCHQVLSFLKRLNLQHVEGLESKTMDAYYTNLYRVEQYNLNGHPTTEEAAIIRKWLASYTPPSLEDCRFGSGATCDSSIKSIGQKYHNMYETERTYYFCVQNGLIPSKYIWKGSTHSRVKCVPKSYKTFRPIAMEHHMLMFYQQGVLASLDRVFCQKLHRRIDLHNQQRSRVLAQIGSINGTYATIDLSSASDSVSMRVFRQWFSHSAAYRDLLCLRSGYADTPDGTIRLPQYASMGSALCFPVECLVFAAMCEATIRECGVDPHTSDYCVYGDDIIIETEFARPLIERLRRNGFLVNDDKSFIDGPFRESCGGEYYRGYPVNPVKIPRRLNSDLTSPNSFSALISLANACFARGLFTTRLLIISLLGHKSVLPWTDDLEVLDDTFYKDTSVDMYPSSSRIYTPGHVDSLRIWNDDLQRSSEVTLGITSHVSTTYDDEAGRLLAVLHKPESAQLSEKLATPRRVGGSRPIVDIKVD